MTSPEKISEKWRKQLEDLQVGVDWQKKLADERWNLRYQELLKFREQYGNVPVPRRYIDSCGMNLSDWLADQRKLYRRGELGEDRARKIANEIKIKKTRKRQ